MVIAGGMAILGGIGVCFGGPGHKDLGADGEILRITFVWNEKFNFAGV